MWITVLVMGLVIALEPFRIGMAVLMLHRPHPVRQLVTFLCGGFLMGLSVGLVVLFAFRDVLVDSTHFTLPHVQLGIGTLALAAAGYLFLRRDGVTKPDGWLLRRIRQLLTGRSLWVAGVAGLGIALPSVDYLAVLAVILSSGSGAATQVAALVAFNIIAFALIEIPLLAYLVAPQRTVTAMTRLNEWIRARRRREVAILLTAVGTILVAAGLIGL
ncbi:MAG: GAP family protein [Mycobacterium sp.]